jgi:hypothetical protein
MDLKFCRERASIFFFRDVSGDAPRSPTARASRACARSRRTSGGRRIRFACARGEAKARARGGGVSVGDVGNVGDATTRARVAHLFPRARGRHSTTGAFRARPRDAGNDAARDDATTTTTARWRAPSDRELFISDVERAVVRAAVVQLHEARDDRGRGRHGSASEVASRFPRPREKMRGASLFRRRARAVRRAGVTCARARASRCEDARGVRARVRWRVEGPAARGMTPRARVVAGSSWKNGTPATCRRRFEFSVEGNDRKDSI